MNIDTIRAVTIAWFTAPRRTWPSPRLVRGNATRNKVSPTFGLEVRL